MYILVDRNSLGRTRCSAGKRACDEWREREKKTTACACGIMRQDRRGRPRSRPPSCRHGDVLLPNERPAVLSAASHSAALLVFVGLAALFRHLCFAQALRLPCQGSAPAAKTWSSSLQWERVSAGPLKIFSPPPPRLQTFFFWARRVGVSPAFLVGSAVVFGATRLVGEKRTLIFRETCIGPRGPRSGALHPWKKEERRCSFRHRLLDFLCQLPGTLARVTKGTNRCLWVGGL